MVVAAAGPFITCYLRSRDSAGIKVVPKTLRGISVLVIDDNENMRKIICTVLRGAGIEDVRLAENGEDALACVNSGAPSLAFVDYHMHPTNGIDFVRALRTSETRSKRVLPVVIVDRTHQ